MKPIIKYQANDGIVFDTDEQAKAHENILVEIGKAMTPLGTRPEHAVIQKGWIQHSAMSYELAKKNLLLLAIPTMVQHKFIEMAETCEKEPEKVHPMSYIGRFIGECCDGALNEAWWRLMCFDGQFREHSQPYFAISGPAPEHACLEDRR